VPKHVRLSIYQDATWHGRKTRPRILCVRWGPSSPSPKGGGGSEPPHQFSAHVHCGQTTGWIKMALGIVVGLGPGYIVLDWDPAPLPKSGAEPLPNFRSISRGWMHQDVTRYGGRPQPRRVCVRWGPIAFPKKGAEPPSPI